MRQTYSIDYLQDIVSDYNIGSIVDHFLFTSGFENSNYYIKTSQGEYVLKIFEGVNIISQNIKFEVEVMDRGYCCGVKTPKIYKNKFGKLTTETGGKLSVLMNFIDGENAGKQTVSDLLVKEVGEEVGKMDSSLAIFRDGTLVRQNYEFDGKNFLILEDKLKYLSEELDKKIFEDIFENFKKNKSILDTLPKGVIHNDVVLHNLLLKDGHLEAIIDFSDMAFSPYIQNVAVSMAQIIFTYNWQPHQAKIFIDSYKKFNQLSEMELSLLYDLTLSRYALCIIELNYWNISFSDDPQRKEFIDDNYSFLKRFLSLGRENFNLLIT